MSNALSIYGNKSKSTGQKIAISLLEILLIIFSYWLMFQKGIETIYNILGLNILKGTNYESKTIILIFSIIVFFRYCFMMLYLLTRTIPWAEVLPVSFAFGLYFVGFAFFVYNRQTPIDLIDYIGISLFIIGSFLNTFSELERHFWKQKPENKGKLWTNGLFKYSMHINFFGDVLWVLAYAIITRNSWSFIIPISLFVLFVAWYIPTLDKYLLEKYKNQFKEYAIKTKKLIPFIY